MTEASQVRWGTTQIPFAIRRSGRRRRTVALTIDAGRLVVTANPDVPVARLNDVVRRKALWVVPRLKKSVVQPTGPREFVTGESVLYRGRQLRLKVIEAGAEAPPRMWAGWYEVTVRRHLAEVERQRDVRRRLAESMQDHASIALPEVLAEVCHRLRLPVPEMVVRGQALRWGSCDAKGVLRINWRIVQAAPSQIEYVLVHEMVHLTHRTHGAAFWRQLGQLMPSYEERRRRLLEVGPWLVW